MPMLSQRHELFARRRVTVLDEPAAASYRLCGYKAAKGNSSAACASRLLTQANIIRRIDELRELAAKRHQRTVDGIADELDQAHKLALETGQASAAVSATWTKAKLFGLVVNRSEHRTA